MHTQMKADCDVSFGEAVVPWPTMVSKENSYTVDHQCSDAHWRWRLWMAERIASDLDPDQLGVVAIYIFGSVKNATAGPGSDIDLLVHFRGTDEQRRDLEKWFQTWNAFLDAHNCFHTGYRVGGLLDVHIITDKAIERRSSFAVKIDAVTDAARKLPMKSSRHLK